jgi:hypothetical protein
MLTQEETVAFGNEICELLKGEMPVEDIIKVLEAKVADVPPEHFQEWARLLVDNSQSGADKAKYRERLQRLNVLAIKVKAFDETVGRYHEWKNKSALPSVPDAEPPADPR